VVLVAGWVLGAGPPAAWAQTIPDTVRAAAQKDFHGPDGRGKDGPLSNVGMDLLLLYHHARLHAEDALPSDAEDWASAHSLQIRDGRVVVEAIAAGDVAALKADLEALGMTNAAAAGNLVSGALPIAQISALGSLETLQSARPSRPRTQQGGPSPGMVSGGAATAPPSGQPPRTPPSPSDTAPGPSGAGPGEVESDRPVSSSPESTHLERSDSATVSPSRPETLPDSTAALSSTDVDSDRTPGAPSNVLAFLALAVVVVLLSEEI